MAELRKISPDELQEILVGHQRWLESEGKEGGRANLGGANLQKADLRSANLQEAGLFLANLQEAKLRSANLQEAYLHGTEGLTASQVKDARNYKLAYYDDEFLKKYGKELGLSQSNREHTVNVRKKLAELEKKKKEAATKK